MVKLSPISGRKLAGILGNLGYKIVRQKGSHMRLSAPGKKSITIPDYKSIDQSLIRKIIRDAEINMDEFIKLT